MSKEAKKMGLFGLILMVFTSVFGFANGPVAFYRMGYAAIIWYILAAFLFFIPYALMMAEYGASFKDSDGGIYTWMKESVGPLYAFIGTFMWFASYVIWLVGMASKVWIPLTTLIFGEDKTQTWSVLGLSPMHLLGILAIVWIIFVTFLASKGMNQITKVTSLGGIAVMGLNLVLLIVSIVVWFLNKGQLAQPIEGVKSFIQSPNPAFTGAFSIFGFFIFAIFAYGGLEAIGSLVDKTENAEKNFPKGIMISAVVISIGYAVGIFLWGVTANWGDVLSGDKVNLGNITYVLMHNLGLELGKAMGLGLGTATTIGVWFARITGLSMFLAYTGGFFTLIYSPLKTLIQGTPKELWPAKMTTLNKHGMPEFAMWIQAILVAVIIAILNFGGKGAQEFYNILTYMTNVAMVIPYFFLSAAFYQFKIKDNINHPFMIFKKRSTSLFITIVVSAVIALGIVFQVFEPLFRSSGPVLKETIYMIVGPLAFSLIAIFMYKNYERKMNK